MKLILALAIVGVILISGCISHEPQKAPMAVQPSEKAKAVDWESLASVEPPKSYQIEDVKFYAETGKCYAAGAMGMLRHWGAPEEEVQNYWQWIKTNGGGGPPDFALALKELGYSEYLYFSYSRNPPQKFPKPYFNHFLKDPGKQLKVFENKDEAFSFLKKLIASNIPVMVVREDNPELRQDESQDNDYILVVGYDEERIYYHALPGVKTSDTIADFLQKWELQSGSDIFSEFPGNYGIIFLKPRLT